MHPKAAAWTAVFALAALSLCAPAPAQEANKTPERKKLDTKDIPGLLWRDPGDVASLNMQYGAGGSEHQPQGKLKFLEEDMEGTNPKFDAEDEQGIRWKVKMGGEARPETAATRLLWAAGYFVDEDYYLPVVQVEGMKALKRGQKYVSPDGAVQGARLKRHIKGEKKAGNWSWFNNRFEGTRELNGLRVMMALMNNWDLKESNNKIYTYEKSGEARYVVSDLGASFGKTGAYQSRSKGKVEDYRRTQFLKEVQEDYVDFNLHSRPLFPVAIFNHRAYRMRTDMEKIVQHIPRADAKWIGQRLALLSHEQIRDCFRAGGYSREEAEDLAQVVEKRIAELNRL